MKLGKIINLGKDIILAKLLNRKFPLRVKHRVTYRCNTTCYLCLLKKKINTSEDIEMSTLQAKSMMKEFKYFGTRFWLFTGGEPLLREDLGELINYAKNKIDFYCGINTNGILLAERIKNDPAFKLLDLVQISIAGPKQIHDRLYGIGTYDKIISALDILRESHIKTVILALVHKDNLSYLHYLIKLAAQYDAKVAFLAPGSQPAAMSGSINYLFPQQDTFKKIIKELIEEKKESHLIISSFFYLKMLRDYWPDTPHKIKCYAGQFYCEITPEGFVGPCCAKLDQFDTNCNGVNIGFKKAFFRLDNMAGCRDCYYAGSQELNILLEMIPFKVTTLFKEYIYSNYLL